MTGTTQLSYDSSGLPSATRRNELIQFNSAVTDLASVANQALQLDALWFWFGGGANGGTTPLARGSTDTNLATSALTGAIAGVPFSKATVAAGTALGALGTIPQNKWGLIAVDVVAAGTISYVSAAANYTTGYATEAAAIAALPPRLTVKARLGYITIQSSSNVAGWVAGTDALAGGATGNPAAATNYYPQAGILAPTGNNAVNGWTGGTNGVLITPAIAIGSTDTNVSNLAFTYNANGIANIPKAAVAAGTAFGALGTIPASKWGCMTMWIDAAGAITWVSMPLNYTTGYATEAAAINDIAASQVPSGKCRMGYVTVLASASTWVAGTDALAGGSSGNPATTTHYFSSAGITLASGMTAAQVGNMTGVAISV